MDAHMDRFRIRPWSAGRTREIPAAPVPMLSDQPPVPTRILSCNRCRHFKKKCSKTAPTCRNCAKAGVRCSLGVASREPAQLQARLAWMEGIVNEGLLRGRGRRIQDVETGTSLLDLGVEDVSAPPTPGQQVTPDSGQPSEATVPYSTPDSISLTQPDIPMVESVQEADGRWGARSEAEAALQRPRTQESIVLEATQSTSTSPSATEAGLSSRDLVDAYFRDMHCSYPFLEKGTVLSKLERLGIRTHHDVQAVGGGQGFDATQLALVMAIGYTTLQRARQLPVGTDEQAARPSIDYKDIITTCLTDESLETVQILLLLALFSLFDPDGFSTRPIVDLLARQASRLCLGQRDHFCHDVGDAARPPDAGRSLASPGTMVEYQRRLFWSVYVLDRMLAASAGLPIAMWVAPDVRVPLPGITVEEFASSECAQHTATLHIARQVIQLRRLEDKVLQRVHLRGRMGRQSLGFDGGNGDEDPSPAQNNSRALVDGLRTEIEDWHSNGCLLRSTDTDNARIHIRIAWLASRYYNLLLLLYYPSAGSSTSGLVSRRELASMARKHVQANAVRFQQRQLPLQHNTLCRLLFVALVFLYCYLGSGTDTDHGMHVEVDIVADMMEAFPEHWQQARRAADLVRQLAYLIRTAAAPTQPVSGSALANALQNSFDEIVQEVLGRGSAFRLIHS